MRPQYKISEELLFFFRDGWIELAELYKKKYVLKEGAHNPSASIRSRIRRADPIFLVEYELAFYPNSRSRSDRIASDFIKFR
jgi:hypothetical protein